MARTVEHSVYLVKDLLLEGPGVVVDNQGTLIKILEKDVHHRLNAIRSSSSLTTALADCIKEREGGPLIRLRIKADRRGYDIYLHEKLVKGFCAVLPQPFLQVRFRMQVPKRQRDFVESTAVFEQRLELAEARAAYETGREWSSWPRVYPVSEAKDKNVLCDVIIGWTEAPKSKPIKMSLAPFGKILFEKEASKDLTLVAGNGSEVKCHRDIFQAHSVVLAAMLSPNNWTLESKTGRVEMRENSEEGLTRLIRYFYGMELTTEDLTCDVALELLKTAHKYMLTQLLGSLIQMILQRGNDWFTPDGLLELYFHAKNLEQESNDWKKAMYHSLKLMLSSTSEIQSCDGYKEIARTDPDAATHLVWKLLELKTKQQEAKTSGKRKRRDE